MKSLFKNSLYNITYKLFMIAFPLVSSAYVSRVLLPAGVGKVAYAQNIASYFITIASLGVGSYGVREIGKNQKNKSQYSQTVAELLLVTLISTIVCSVIYYGMIFSFPYFRSNRALYYAVGIQLILTAANVDWFYQGMEEYGYITIRSLIIKILTLIGIFVFVKNKNDLVPYALLSSIALAGNNIINLIHLKKYVVRFDIHRIELKQHLKPLLVLLSTGFAVELYTKLDTTTLGLLTSEECVGYYNYATKITSIVVNLAASVSTILLPRFSLYREQNRFVQLRKTIENAQSVILFISIPAVIGIVLTAKNMIVFLFGKSFLSAVTTIQILSILVIIKSIGNLYGVQVLVAFGKEKTLFYTTVLGAISNVGMNIILIPILQQNGAAIASVLSELAVCIYQCIAARKQIFTKIDKIDLCKIVTATAVMGVVVYIVVHCVSNTFISIMLSCLMGAFSYFMMSIVLRIKISDLILKKIKTVLKR